LKSTKNSGYGTRSTKGIIFKHYPTSKLENFKKFIIDRNNIQSNIPSKATIIDWKYMDIISFQNSSNKLDSDISKQLCYEHCLLKSDSLQIESKIDSWFAIPYFYPIELSPQVDFEPLESYTNIYDRVQKNGIEIYKFNFSVMQKTYISNDQ
jgi:hypothetical protein